MRHAHIFARGGFAAAALTFSLAGCGGASVAVPAAGGPAAAAPSNDVVRGTHPIDPFLAQQFRRARLGVASWLRRGAFPASKVPKSIHSFWAIFPKQDTGVQADQLVWPKLTVSNAGTYIYAPTMYPSNNACIETTTAYYQGGSEVWAWDWCSTSHKDGNVGTAVDIDAKFLEAYTRPADGASRYRVRIVQTNAAANEWTDYLFNFSTGKWDKFYVSSGTADIAFGTGWDAYETYSGVDRKTARSNMCGDVSKVGPIRSVHLDLQSGSRWSPSSPSDSIVQQEGDFYCPLAFTVPTPNSSYSVFVKSQ